MSTRVTLVCEDHTNDQYIVKPIVQAALTEAGRPSAKIHIVTSPQLRGWDSVKREACALMRRYGPFADLVVFAVDLDCQDGRKGASNKPSQLRGVLGRCDMETDKALLLFARQEVEVWALWGVRSRLGASWSDVRDHCDPKDTYFVPIMSSLGEKGPGGGRRELVSQSLGKGWRSLAQGCPELQILADEVRDRLSAP
jgi:hypothetical protein